MPLLLSAVPMTEASAGENETARVAIAKAVRKKLFIDAPCLLLDAIASPFFQLVARFNDNGVTCERTDDAAQTKRPPEGGHWSRLSFRLSLRSGRNSRETRSMTSDPANPISSHARRKWRE
jgi:hypothetical protein